MKKTYLLCSAILLSIGFSRTACGASLVYIDFDGNSATAETTWTINPGDSFTANLYASDIADLLDQDHGGLLGFGLDLAYDPAAVTANSFSLGPGWLPSAGVGITPGNVSLAGLTFFGFPTVPPLLLGSATFASTGLAGVFDLDLSDRLIDEWGSPYPDSFLFDHLITFQDTRVNVVPLPAAVWFLGAGLAGLFGWRSRSGKTA